MNLNRNGKIARLPDRLGEEGEWKVEDGDAMNRAKSSLIQLNGEPGNLRLRRLSKRVQARQTTFHNTGVSIQDFRGSRAGHPRCSL